MLDLGTSGSRRHPRWLGLGQGLAFGNPLYGLTLGRARPKVLRVVPPDPWAGDAERGAAMLGGLYRFGGQTLRAEQPPWQPLGLGEDFVAEWNGFAWLRDLRAAGGDKARRLARRLVSSWLDRQDRWHKLIWRQDVLGQRIASWIATHDFFCGSAEDEFRERVFASLARQHRHLARTVPGGHQGAPLLVAIKGLIYGALALPGGDRRLAHGLRLLDRELDRQVLPDGGHVQRNPLVHLAVLRHLVDLRGALRAAQAAGLDSAEPSEALQSAIDRMAPPLRLLRHGDGALALFNGGCEGDPALIEAVLAQAEAHGRPIRRAPDWGYERVMAGRTMMVVDVAGPPPAGLDGDFHAGALSFELSVARERMIVNCGAWPGRFGREAMAWRDALRGTAAHSTLTVSDTNSRPLSPDREAVRRSGTIRAERHELDGAVLIDASHDYYRAHFGAVHRRRLYLGDQGNDLRGEDTLAVDAGRITGRLPFALRFHLHPGVRAELAAQGGAALITLPSGAAWRLRASGGVMSIEETVYFGQPEEWRRSAQIVITAAAGGDSAEGRPIEAVIKWALKRDPGTRTPDETGADIAAAAAAPAAD